MGNDEELEEEKWKARYWKEQAELADEEIERKKIQADQYLQRQVEINKMRNKQRIQNAQNSYDAMLRNYILQNQQFAGYKVNPYNMSSSELEYWEKKINEEIDRKRRELDYKTKNLCNNMTRFNNNFYY